MLRVSLKTMKEQAAVKNNVPPSRNTNFCFEIADRLDHVSEKQAAMAKLRYSKL